MENGSEASAKRNLYISTQDAILGTTVFSFQFDADVYLIGCSIAVVYDTAGTETFSISGGLISSTGHPLWETLLRTLDTASSRISQLEQIKHENSVSQRFSPPLGLI